MTKIIFEPEIHNLKYISEMSKIADEKLQSVSFHNHLPVIFLVQTPGLRTANRKNTLHPLIGASVAFNSGAIV